MNNLTIPQLLKNFITNETGFNKWIQDKPLSIKQKNVLQSNLIQASADKNLEKVNDIYSIITACYHSVLFDLPLSNQFGFCYIVPRKDSKENKIKAQFQIGAKGYVQLGLRTGQYKTISYSNIKQGELIKLDKLQGNEYSFIQNESDREKLPTVGYVAYFKLMNGFEKDFYFSEKDITNNFKKYSEPYKKYGKFPVGTFEDMSLKTTLTHLLRKWGIMSIEMQQAYEADQAIINMDLSKDYIDNPNTNKEIEQKQFINDLSYEEDLETKIDNLEI